MLPKKVFIVSDYSAPVSYARMFADHGWHVVPRMSPDVSLVQFIGGADVSPVIYGEKQITKTRVDETRDLNDAAYYAIAKRMGLKMAGICRGGQFLNVMCGGSMYQDVNGHATGMSHNLMDLDTGEVVSVSSTHHQMMIPGATAEVVAVADVSRTRTTDKGTVERSEGEDDIEVLFYKDEQCLCFQPHPEFYNAQDTDKYYFRLLKKYFNL